MVGEVGILDPNYQEEHTSLRNNRCRNDDGGRIVQQFISVFRGQRYYSPPKCEKCGRIHKFAQNTIKVGYADFRRRTEKPFTV